MIIISIYPWNLIVFFFAWLFFSKMSTLKPPKIMIAQSLKECWFIIQRLFKNVKIKQKWTLYTHMICFSFLVLILKVVVLKNSKRICMSYIIINPWLSWIEICEYFDEFINVHICWFMIRMIHVFVYDQWTHYILNLKIKLTKPHFKK
jgi:hypothetical protein